MKKFALFEFEDRSVGVGPLESIVVQKPADLELVKIDDSVTVRWPFLNSGKTGGSTSNHVATVLAINESELKVRQKSKLICNGLSIETDVEEGRGMRRKVATSKKQDSSSEDDMVIDEEKPPASSKVKKARQNKGGDLHHANSMANQLRNQMGIQRPKKAAAVDIQKPKKAAAAGIQKPKKAAAVAVACLDSDEEDPRAELARVKIQLKREREEKERLQHQLKFFEGIPKFITTFEGFMADMEKSTLKIKSSPRVQQESPQLPTSPSGSHSSSSSVEITFGSGVILRRKLLACNHHDAGKLTSDLMVSIFGRDKLDKCSLTGAPNSKGVAKPALDKEQVAAIVEYVVSKFPSTTPSQIKSFMSNKISNEAKLKRRRMVKMSKAKTVDTVETMDEADKSFESEENVEG